MSLENKTIKELKVLAKKKQQRECPSYSKMNKKKLIDYLSSDKSPIDSLSLTRKRLSPKKSPLRIPQTDAIRQQQIQIGLEKEKLPLRIPQTDAIRQQQIQIGLEKEKKTKKLSPKKSSGPFNLEKVFKENQKGYKTPKVYKKKSSDPYYLDKVFKSPTQKKRTVRKPKKISGTTDSFQNMKVVDLKKECKKLGLKTTGKKSDLIKRIKEKQNFDLARQNLQKTVRPKKNSLTSAEARVAKSLEKLLD